MIVLFILSGLLQNHVNIFTVLLKPFDKLKLKAEKWLKGFYDVLT